MGRYESSGLRDFQGLISWRRGPTETFCVPSDFTAFAESKAELDKKADKVENGSSEKYTRT